MQDGVFGTQSEPLEALFLLVANDISQITQQDEQTLRQMVPSLGWSPCLVTIYFTLSLVYLFLVLFLISLVPILPIKSILKLVI